MSITIELFKYFYKTDRMLMESMNKEERREFVRNSDEYKLIDEVQYEFGNVYIPRFMMKHKGELVLSYNYWFDVFLDFNAYKETPQEYYHRIKATGYRTLGWIKMYYRAETTKLLHEDFTDAFEFEDEVHPVMEGNEILDISKIKAPEMKEYSKSDYIKARKASADLIGRIKPYDHTKDPDWSKLSQKLIDLNKKEK